MKKKMSKEMVKNKKEQQRWWRRTLAKAFIARQKHTPMNESKAIIICMKET